MSLILTFVIPLISPKASKDWQCVLDRLDETARSIENIANECQAIRAIVVATQDAVLRPLPTCFDIVRTDLPPPAVSVFRGECDERVRKDALFWDKGYKTALGMIHAKQRGSTFVMGVDADDLLSKRILDLVRDDTDAFGWYISKGWILPLNSKWGILLQDFHNWCGTYAIVRTDILPLHDSVEEMHPEIVKSLFGNHRELIPYLEHQKRPLKPIDFHAAVYRVDNPSGNFGRRNLRSSFFRKEKLLNEPRSFFRWLLKLRYFGEKERSLFLGSERAQEAPEIGLVDQPR
ncbi:hypothetical protein RE428_36090 [Marinobacter nanhaiticus D15-8W]|uniref:Glycosyltransferase family 2 protein n=1 Tax=Marinobacter nanhaiticus D15-8W TaxID=626887 RepID=N6WZ08_9GAMM|nr:hypothetical protein [Marinobacter nanhaiticus]ENO16776.1 hypothetical protein J057_03690 [Marinobacter nanhaiticus D15-8W]BES72591.1 hypothetical protein RE428_36090 [Marinobacter nanhaiticus D15-8W]